MPLYLYILLGIAGIGIVFVVLSHNRRAKRIMLPIANTAFHLVVLLVVFSGDARLRVPRPVAVIVLLANAVWCSGWSCTVIVVELRISR